MVGRENQRLEDEHQEPNVTLNGDSCIGVNAEAEEVSNCSCKPLEDHHKSYSTPSSGRSVEEEASVVGLDPQEIIRSVETNAAEELMEAMNSPAVVPMKEEIYATKGPPSVPETRATIDSRSVSAIAVISLFLFVILYPRFCGQNLFVDFVCFTLLILFYFYRVEVFGRN